MRGGAQVTRHEAERFRGREGPTIPSLFDQNSLTSGTSCSRPPFRGRCVDIFMNRTRGTSTPDPPPSARSAAPVRGTAHGSCHRSWAVSRSESCLTGTPRTVLGALVLRFHVLGGDAYPVAGRDRMQAFDRNWKVCSQNYAPGKTIPVDTKLDFGAVKLEEDCPAKDQKESEVEGGKMPNLAGKSVKTARGTLDSGTSITVTDATGDRMVLLESNWKVCTQSPSPGAALTGQPVEFTAVKYDETCP
ncbi:hypothetical protein [Streptomyces atratus]|uniref:hypothetical protein n=1 Tax=Streptomyces atratus TaxID=1893 RepID=UPI0037B37BEA